MAMEQPTVGQHPLDTGDTGPDVQPEYEPPQVITYRGEEILEELGPAQACSFNHSVVICP
jgi:hypothetical protein